MTFQITTLSLSIQLVAVAIILVLAAIIWTRRPAPGATPLAALMLVGIAWIVIRSLQVAATDFEVKVLFGKTIFFLTTSIAILWLFFTLDYTGSNWWRKPRNWSLLCIIPLIAAVILLINRAEVYQWLKITPDIEASRKIVIWEKGPFFWLQTIHIVALFVAGAVILCRFTFSGKNNHRWQVLAILIGIFIPVASHAVETLDFLPSVSLDITPFTLAIAGLIYTAIISRFRLLDVVPLARGALIENMPDGILVLNAENSIADLNPAARRMLSLNRSAFAKRIEVICPWLYKIISVIGYRQRIELSSAATGSGMCLEIIVTPLLDGNSSFTGSLVVLKDITERKKAEEALKTSEEKYRSLVNNIKLGVFRSSPHGKHLEVNKAMETITGYSRQELLSIDISDLYLYPEERQEFLNQCISKPEKTANEIWNKRKDGSSIIVAATITPVRDPGGNILYYDGILEDITERKRLIEQTRELYEKEKSQRQELEEEAKARGLFINALGHELRTPLTPIISSADLLRNIFSRDPESVPKQLIHNICRGAHTLDRRLDDLLDLGKFSRGELDLKFVLLDPKQLIERVAFDIESVIQPKCQKLFLDLAESLPFLEADPSRLEQVLVNLLSNASQFSPEGGKIILRAREGDGNVLLEVQDEGVAISPEEQLRLFQPYHRVEQDRAKFSGLGLGLAISKQIIEAHKGKIWVTSQIGQGSTFSFSLPVNH